MSVQDFQDAKRWFLIEFHIKYTTSGPAAAVNLVKDMCDKKDILIQKCKEKKATAMAAIHAKKKEGYLSVLRSYEHGGIKEIDDLLVALGDKLPM